MNHEANNSSKGFTLIELLLAMTFVTVLLIVIAMTVIQIANIYNKGLTMKAVDQAGRLISEDMRRTLANSQPLNIDSDVKFQRYPNTPQDTYDGGRLCTGQYSYVWNFGQSMDDPINKYATGSDEIRMVRVRDNGGQYCANQLKKIINNDATELLSAGDRDLAIQSFSISHLSDDATIGQALYRIVIEIGTNNQDALMQTESLDTIDTSCRPPSDDASLQDYCAVNQFDFTAQAGNGGGK